MTSMSFGLVRRVQGFYFSLPGFCFILVSLQLPPCSNVRICYSLRKNSTLLVHWQLIAVPVNSMNFLRNWWLLRQHVGVVGFPKTWGYSGCIALQVSRKPSLSARTSKRGWLYAASSKICKRTDQTVLIKDQVLPQTPLPGQLSSL